MLQEQEEAVLEPENVTVNDEDLNEKGDVNEAECEKSDDPIEHCGFSDMYDPANWEKIGKGWNAWRYFMVVQGPTKRLPKAFQIFI